MKHSLRVQKTAQFYTLDEVSNQDEIIIVLHGYGFTAKNFIQEFTSINTDNRLIVAPEGMNKFYLRGYSGDVGANWMTKEERIHEIEDHINFLDDVVSSLRKSLGQAKITVLGFSQGAEMASRWSLLGNTNIDQLIIWSGKVASDLNFDTYRHQFNKLNVKLVVGDDDSFISEEALLIESNRLKEVNVEYELIRFVGGHIIHQNTLHAVFRKTISE